jgi:hypothetical protein
MFGVRIVALNTAGGRRVSWSGVPAMHVVPRVGVRRGTPRVVSVRVCHSVTGAGCAMTSESR